MELGVYKKFKKKMFLKKKRIQIIGIFLLVGHFWANKQFIIYGPRQTKITLHMYWYFVFNLDNK